MFKALGDYITNPQEQENTALLVNALRQFPQGGVQMPVQQAQQAAPQGNRVVSAAPPPGTYDPLIKPLGSLLGQGVSNIGTALKYDTTPFSQQTNMLNAQDMGMGW